MKWKQTDYKSYNSEPPPKFINWRCPPLIYPCSPAEAEALQALKGVFEPLPPYKQMEAAAIEQNALVSIEVPLPDGYIAFLENTAEKCTSPQTKHSREGMQGARHWVQRVDTPENMFRRLTDGYGKSLMFGERCHQYIRNSNNYRGNFGMMLDIDVFRENPESILRKAEAEGISPELLEKRLKENEARPEPCDSQAELFDRYPILPRICSLILPTASSLHEGRPYKARGGVLFPEVVTDMRVYRAFGDMLLSELDCVPANVTKNPIAVGFGNTHNAALAHLNLNPDIGSISDALKAAASTVKEKTKKSNREQKQRAKRTEHYRVNGTADGENISEFIDKCNPVAEMVRAGLLTPGRGNEYRWHESEHDRSCSIQDGGIRIFSATMFDASPHQIVNEAVGTHRFYLYQLCGLDMTREADRPRLREFLFRRGYGSDPKAFEKQIEKRYQINTKHEHDTSDLETERKANKNVVVQWLQETEKKKGKHLLILGSAAGTGKTTVGIFTADSFLYIGKTTEEADKVYEALDEKEEDVYRHRPRMFNRGHTDIDGNNDWETLPLGLGEHDRPCIHPETCDLMAERGHAPTAFCATQCKVYADCTENYFLSQAQKEKNASKVIYAWGEDMAVDALLAKYIKRICAKGDVLIVDEVNPLNVTQRRTLNRDILFDLVQRFRHPHEKTADIYTTLKALLDLQSTAETPEKFIAGIQQWIDGIENIETLDKQIERYPVGMVFRNTPENAEHKQPFEATIEYLSDCVTVPVVDHDTADDTPAYQIDPETPIETDKYHVQFVSFSFLRKVGLANFDDPPRRHRNLLTDLKTFFDENTNIETAPFAFDPKQQTFEFHLKPTLNHHRVIFNTASDPDNLIGETYRETDINITRHTGTPPPWKTDLVFQISSGNYLPRHSLIRQEGEGEDKVLYLKPRAQELVDAFIRPSIEAGLSVLVVAPKAFQEVESVVGDGGWAVTDDPELPPIEAITPGQTAFLINHHHAEGRNDYQDFEIVFVFHYEPNHNEIPLAAKRIYRNPETPLDFTREKRTVSVGGVSFKKVVYIDERVQAIYNRECRQRLMQSDMRLRPNIHEGKIIVNLTAEPVDIPVTPVAFAPSDAKHFAGDWAAFKAKLHATDTKAFAEATGQSQRTAARKTKAARDQQKAERNAEIIRLDSEGNSLRDIHQQMKNAGYKVSLGTIGSVLRDRAKNDNPLLYSTNSTLSLSARHEIYRKFTAGESKASLAQRFEVDRETIDDVLATYKF